MKIKLNDSLTLNLSDFGYGACCTILTILFFLNLSACGLKTGNPVIYHTLEYPPPDKEVKTPVPYTLMVYHFLLAPEVESDSILTSPSKKTEKSVQIHRWQENPADIITDILLRDLEASGIFRNVVDQLSNVRYRYSLEGTLREMHGVIKNGSASAVIELEVTFTDFEASRPMEKDLLKKTYKMDILSKDSSAESILAAFSTGVREISELLRTDIRTVLGKRGDPDPRGTRR